MNKPRITCVGGGGGLAELFASSPLRGRLDAIGDLRLHRDHPDAEALAERIRAADVVLLTEHVSDEVLRAAAGRVRLLAFTGTGAASYVNLPLARELGIAVTNVTGYGDQAVAELTLALLLASARQVSAGDRALRAGDWRGLAGRELAGERIGIAGFGGIGRTFARLAHAIGMGVDVWSRSVDPEELAAVGGVVEPSLARLFSTHEVVSLHLPLTPQTRGIVTGDLVAALPAGAILVNTARGELIAPGALDTRLAAGDLHVALDVFDPEPLPSHDPLLDSPHAVLTPHQGFRTPQASARMATGAVECVEAFLAGTPIRLVT